MDEARRKPPRHILLRPLPIMFGMLGGLGVAVLLQQFAVTPLTTPFLASMMLAGLLLIGVAIPTALMHAKRGATTRNARRRRGRTTAVSIIALAALAAVLLVALGANAEMDGPCSATLDGEAFHGEVEMPEDGTIDWSLTSHTGNIEAWEIVVHYAWFSFVVDEGRDDPPKQRTKSGTEDLSDYPSYGAGVYRLTGSVVTEDGATCSGSADVIVPGNPFTTLIGGVATGLGLIGIVGGTVSAKRAADREVERENER